MKVGPKEQQTRMLGPTGIERQLGSPLKAGHTVTNKPAITVTKLQQSVTRVTNKSVTAANSVTPKSVTGKRGPKPKGETAMTAAERMKAYRNRRKVK